jgi:phosphoglycolate phosphatase-like HAD superfamily hydrolase
MTGERAEDAEEVAAAAQSIAGVLFDLDGTLVDTGYIHAICWWEALRQYDHVVPMAAIHRAIGMGSDKLLDHILGSDRDTTDDDDLSTAHGALFATWYTRICPLPGARDLLAKCAELGLTVVIATSAKERDLAALRTVLDADSFIDEITTAADANESKPSPDILSTALDKGGLRADRVVFVGDAVWDVIASKKLGIPCIGLESGGTSEAELREAGAVEIWKDPADLLENLPDSVLGRRPDGSL